MQLKEKGLAILKMYAVLFLFFIPTMIISFAVNTILGLMPGINIISLNEHASILMLINGIIAMIVILLVCFVITKIYKIKIKELGMLFTKHWLSNYGIGIVIGTLTILTAWILSTALGGYKIKINDLNQAVFISIFINFIIMLMVGYYEEVLLRGLMTFVGVKNNKLFNATIVAVIFSLIHLFNPSYNILSMLNTFLVSIVFSMLTWVSGDLWTAIGYHTFWNFIMGNVLGVPVSGIDTKGILISSPSSSDLISGGLYGLEASLVCSFILLIQIMLIYMFFIAKGKTNKEPVAPWLA